MKKFILFAIMVFVCCACSTHKTIEYVDRDVVKYQTKIQHDTLINNIHDSVYHTIFQKGDTIYDTKYVEHTKYRDKIVIKSDTCWRDSVITVHKETVMEVIKIPKIYTYALIFSIIVIIFAIYKTLKWLQIIH